MGLPDKDYGEVVGAIIVPREDVKKKAEQESKPVLTLEELSSWAKERLAPYKVLFCTNLFCLGSTLTRFTQSYTYLI